MALWWLQQPKATPLAWCPCEPHSKARQFHTVWKNQGIAMAFGQRGYKMAFPPLLDRPLTAHTTCVARAKSKPRQCFPLLFQNASKPLLPKCCYWHILKGGRWKHTRAANPLAAFCPQTTTPPQTPHSLLPRSGQAMSQCFNPSPHHTQTHTHTHSTPAPHVVLLLRLAASVGTTAAAAAQGTTTRGRGEGAAARNKCACACGSRALRCGGKRLRD